MLCDLIQVFVFTTNHHIIYRDTDYARGGNSQTQEARIVFFVNKINNCEVLSTYS